MPSRRAWRSSLASGSTLIADRASGEVAASLDRALSERRAVATCLSIEALAARPLVAAPPRSSGVARAGRCGHPLHSAAGRRADRPPRDRRRRRAPADSLRAHGWRDAADHVRGHAGRLSPRRSPQPAVVRSDAVGAPADGANGGRHQLHRDVRSVAGVGQDERPDQPALLVEPAGGRGVHDAGLGRRHVRLRRHRRRLLQRQVRHARQLAARARDWRRPADVRHVRSCRPPGRLLGLHATPTPTAIASASWHSAPTSVCAR